MVDFQIIPERTALITIDFQNLFVEGHAISAPTGVDAMNRANGLAATCRQNGVAVIHIAHQLRPDHSNLGVLADVVPTVETKRLLTSGEATADLHAQLDIQDSDWVISKPRLGAFTGSDLELTLRARGIDTLIMAGIATGVCVDTTARQAALLDFKVIMLSDGTATSDINGCAAEDLQRMTLAVFDGNFGQVASVAQMITKIEAAATL
ncbi:MAG: cysteine hydrolase [Rhodospirillaceae bacterium]|jgi:nicotinamidase-related amidase|nr:cysteine hydrolase [Rhodospirillaceae bacterium]MBT5241183.1 cysteine hydrolase [Rhodospirillaceae bacterium]MBT5565182.1 cysteine hydrolase [Rhodospirillaceae bacterium]MBT6088204.1 cysteine hydrolase [Rhodospirillaceae bacterium]